MGVLCPVDSESPLCLSLMALAVSWPCAKLVSAPVAFPQCPSPDLGPHVVVCLLFSKNLAEVGS